MDKKDTQQKNDIIGGETVLKVTKEIVIKFIETGRITPTTFNTTFKSIYKAIDETVNKQK